MDGGISPTCPLCGVQVGHGNLQLHTLRCPGPPFRGRSISEGSWADGSVSRSEEGESEGDVDEDLRLAMALSLSETADTGLDASNAWSCSACTVCAAALDCLNASLVGQVSGHEWSTTTSQS